MYTLNSSLYFPIFRGIIFTLHSEFTYQNRYISIMSELVSVVTFVSIITTVTVSNSLSTLL